MSTAVEFECPNELDLETDPSWWSLYDTSFPPEERESRAVIQAGLRAGVGLAVRARHQNRTIGLGSATILLNPPTVFLSYIAIDPTARGTGVGGALFRFIAGEGARRLGSRGLVARGMLWEVEMAEAASGPGERDQRERRIAFFRRCGGAVLERPYLQPPLYAGDPVIAFHLMYLPIAAPSHPTAAEQEALACAVYREKYAALNGIPEQTLKTVWGTLPASALSPLEDPLSK